MRPERLLVLTSLLAMATGCPGRIIEPPVPPIVVDTPDAGSLARSARGNLRFKGPERLQADFAAALELLPADVCTELGQYQCATFVHNVALGGVDPYGPGLYESSGITAVTTPLVIDRLAWSACTKRVDLDLATPANAQVFRGVPLANGKLTNPEGQEVSSLIVDLTRRGLARDPYANEVARYVKLAKDLEATSAQPARAWMQSVCFAILSSAESVFY